MATRNTIGRAKRSFVTVPMEPATKKALDKIAKEEERSLVSVVRRILKAHLERTP